MGDALKLSVRPIGSIAKKLTPQRRNTRRRNDLRVHFFAHPGKIDGAARTPEHDVNPLDWPRGYRHRPPSAGERVANDAGVRRLEPVDSVVEGIDPDDNMIEWKHVKRVGYLGPSDCLTLRRLYARATLAIMSVDPGVFNSEPA